MSDSVLKQLADVIDSRRGGDAAESYVARLFALGDDAILKKVGEEATEAVLAAKGDDPILWLEKRIAAARRQGDGAKVLESVKRVLERSGQIKNARVG